MGISHEYHSTHGRRRRNKAGTGLRLAGVIAAILLLSLAITAILENGEKQSEAVQQSPAAGTAANILAPLPMQGDDGIGAHTGIAADERPAQVDAVIGKAHGQAVAQQGRIRKVTQIHLPTAGLTDHAAVIRLDLIGPRCLPYFSVVCKT